LFGEEEKELLLKGMDFFNISLPDERVQLFSEYMEMVLDWNHNINLTAITDRKEFILKHLIDSLSIIPHLDQNTKTLIDVGTGAGFPGIPLKIAKEDLQITLLDSLNKRIQFLKNVIFSLNFQHITPYHSRAEDAGNNKDFREKFDCCVSRAVASLPVLSEYCLPFVRVGGVFISMKALSENEIEDSKRALKILGGEIEEVKSFILPKSEYFRKIIFIRKFRHTPTKYPRKAGIPSKDPLK
jgi:16S rRNA (guanine527-N7)-methyltransferase